MLDVGMNVGPVLGLLFVISTEEFPSALFLLLGTATNQSHLKRGKSVPLTVINRESSRLVPLCSVRFPDRRCHVILYQTIPTCRSKRNKQNTAIRYLSRLGTYCTDLRVGTLKTS